MVTTSSKSRCSKFARLQRLDSGYDPGCASSIYCSCGLAHAPKLRQRQVGIGHQAPKLAINVAGFRFHQQLPHWCRHCDGVTLCKALEHLSQQLQGEAYVQQKLMAARIDIMHYLIEVIASDFYTFFSQNSS